MTVASQIYELGKSHGKGGTQKDKGDKECKPVDKHVIYRKINDALVDLVNEIWQLEEEAIITEEFKDITSNDMHIIEKIGLGEGKPMSKVAKRVRITAGSLTTSVNNLVKKGYVVRSRSEKDRRVVYITLTEKGRKAYDHHKQYHEEMTISAAAQLNEEELDVLMEALDKLNIFFRGCHQEERQG